MISFIVCGFPHCVADAFYYLTVPFEKWTVEILTKNTFHFQPPRRIIISPADSLSQTLIWNYSISFDFRRYHLISLYQIFISRSFINYPYLLTGKVCLRNGKVSLYPLFEFPKNSPDSIPPIFRGIFPKQILRTLSNHRRQHISY